MTHTAQLCCDPLSYCVVARKACKHNPVWEVIDNVPERTAQILGDGNPVAWFQGRNVLRLRPGISGDRRRAGAQAIASTAISSSITGIRFKT